MTWANITYFTLDNINKKWRYINSPNLFAKEIIGEQNLTLNFKSSSYNGLAVFQHDFIHYMMTHDIMSAFILAARGASKTFMVALYCIMRMYFNPKLTIAILAGAENQAQICFDFMKSFMRSPEIAKLIINEPLTHRATFRAGGWIRVLTASEKQARGPRINILIHDEMCQQEMEIVEAAEATLSGVGDVRQRIIMTTPDNIKHKCHDWWVNESRLPENQRIFYLLRIPARIETPDDKYEIPWISDEYLKEQQCEVERGIITQEQYDVRFRAKWVNLSDNAFMSNDVEACELSNKYFEGFGIKGLICGIDWSGGKHFNVATYAYINDKGVHVVYTYFIKGSKYTQFINGMTNILMSLYGKCRAGTPITIVTEKSGISPLQNEMLRDAVFSLPCRKYLSYKKRSFTKTKLEHVNTLRALLSQHKILFYTNQHSSVYKIIKQMKNAELSSDGGVKKVNDDGDSDDFLDALLMMLSTTKQYIFVDTKSAINNDLGGWSSINYEKLYAGVKKR